MVHSSLFTDIRLQITDIRGFLMATEAQDHPNRLNAPKIEICSTLSLSKGLPCIAFCEAGSSLGPLHLSRTLYKSATFMQNKPNFQKSQMNANLYNTKDYENKSNWTLGQSKPNSNPIKPNFRKNKCKLLCYRVL